jgi:transposase-like protein
MSEINCPNCKKIHKVEVKDKVEIYCELCCYIFSVNLEGKIEKSKYDKRFDLCSNSVHVRGGSDTKIGQFVWASR